MYEILMYTKKDQHDSFFVTIAVYCTKYIDIHNMHIRKVNGNDKAVKLIVALDSTHEYSSP